MHVSDANVPWKLDLERWQSTVARMAQSHITPQRQICSIHVPLNPCFGIHASIFGPFKPPCHFRRIHVQGIQASNFCRLSLHADFVASTSTQSKLCIQASNFGSIEPRSLLCQCSIHVHSIQASNFFSAAIDVLDAPASSTSAAQLLSSEV